MISVCGATTAYMQLLLSNTIGLTLLLLRILLLLLTNCRHTPSTAAYNKAIAVCADAGRWPEALALVADMKRTGITRTGTTYNAAIHACASGEQLLCTSDQQRVTLYSMLLHR